jgi:hypothetical protein
VGESQPPICIVYIIYLLFKNLTLMTQMTQKAANPMARVCFPLGHSPKKHSLTLDPIDPNLTQ